MITWIITPVIMTLEMMSWVWPPFKHEEQGIAWGHRIGHITDQQNPLFIRLKLIKIASRILAWIISLLRHRWNLLLELTDLIHEHTDFIWWIRIVHLTLIWSWITRPPAWSWRWRRSGTWAWPSRSIWTMTIKC